jgi:L-Ala-D/L-Glu epimerase
MALMAAIAQIEAIPYRLPLKGALRWGKYSQLSVGDHVLLRVTLNDGSIGVAEAPPRPTIYGETVASVVAITDYLASKLLGLAVNDQTAIAEALASVANNHTARGALDMALWQARAHSQGHTLFDLLAGPQQKIKVSYILGISDQQTMLAEAKAVVEAGVRVLKVKVGRDTSADLAVIAALKSEFGSQVTLYADSNETLAADNAAAALHAMRAAGLVYVEEPLPVRQIKARAALKRQQILPIIADDSCFSVADLERELDFDTFDILNIKTARTGFTDSLKMLALAAANHKSVMIGSQASTSIGTIHAALVASQAAVDCPSELSFFLKLEDEIVSARPKLHDGFLYLNELQNITLDADALARGHRRWLES